MKKLNIKYAINLAKNKKGWCLSKNYTNNYLKMTWKCNKNHIWRTTYNVIYRGSWCPDCRKEYLHTRFRNKNGLEKAKKYAKSNEGDCLSEKYINAKSNLNWVCKKGHKWSQTYHNVVNKKRWCPNLICVNEKIKNTCIKKYGVSSPNQDKAVALKQALSSNNSLVLYHWKTDEKLVCVGSYEVATVKYMNKNKLNFRWQPKVFKMPDGRTYRPDMYSFSLKSWIEIKGYFRKDAAEKWKWFQRIKPNSELWDQKYLKNKNII